MFPHKTHSGFARNHRLPPPQLALRLRLAHPLHVSDLPRRPAQFDLCHAASGRHPLAGDVFIRWRYCAKAMFVEVPSAFPPSAKTCLQFPRTKPSCASATCSNPSATARHPHDGIALGFDRLCAILCGTTSLRVVINVEDACAKLDGLRPAYRRGETDHSVRLDQQSVDGDPGFGFERGADGG